MIERVQQHHPSMGQVEIIRYLNDALNDMGFKNVSHVDGGFGAIKHSKFKII